MHFARFFSNLLLDIVQMSLEIGRGAKVNCVERQPGIYDLGFIKFMLVGKTKFIMVYSYHIEERNVSFGYMGR